MKKTRQEVAKDYQKQIAELEAKQEKLYRKALRSLRVPDNDASWDYFRNDQQGYSTFLEGL